MDFASSLKHGRNIKASCLNFVTEIQIRFLLSVGFMSDPWTTYSATWNIRDLCFLDVRACKFWSRKFLLNVNVFKRMKIQLRPLQKHAYNKVIQIFLMMSAEGLMSHL